MKWVQIHYSHIKDSQIFQKFYIRWILSHLNIFQLKKGHFGKKARDKYFEEKNEWLEF